MNIANLTAGTMIARWLVFNEYPLSKIVNSKGMIPLESLQQLIFHPFAIWTNVLSVVSGQFSFKEKLQSGMLLAA